jgi:hypothetical protein
MKPTTPIISGGMNALRLPGFFENLGHGNVINTAGGGSYGHIDSPAAGATSLRQAYECWKAKADPIEWAKEHKEFARAFESFPRTPTRCSPAGATSSARTADPARRLAAERFAPCPPAWPLLYLRKTLCRASSPAGQHQ